MLAVVVWSWDVSCVHCENYFSDYLGRVEGWDESKAGWSSGLGSLGLCSEMSLPALWSGCSKKGSCGV